MVLIISLKLCNMVMVGEGRCLGRNIQKKFCNLSVAKLNSKYKFFKRKKKMKAYCKSLIQLSVQSSRFSFTNRTSHFYLNIFSYATVSPRLFLHLQFSKSYHSLENPAWVPPCYCCWCCSVAKSCMTLCSLMDCRTPGFPVLHYLSEFAQIHAHWVSEAL